MRKAPGLALIAVSIACVAWTHSRLTQAYVPEPITTEQLADLLGLTVWDYVVPEDGDVGSAIVISWEAPGEEPEEAMWVDAQRLSSGDIVRISMRPSTTAGKLHTTLLAPQRASKDIDSRIDAITQYPDAVGGIHVIGADGMMLRTGQHMIFGQPEKDTRLQITIEHDRW